MKNFGHLMDDLNEVEFPKKFNKKLMDLHGLDDHADDSKRPENFDIITGKSVTDSRMRNDRRDPMEKVDDDDISEQFNTDKLTLNDGSTVKLSDRDALVLNRMFGGTSSRKLMKNTMLANLKEFRSVLDFAKTLHETSNNKLDGYVERAVTAHGMANFARRSSEGSNKAAAEYWARKEKNRKQGISTALDKIDRQSARDAFDTREHDPMCKCGGSNPNDCNCSKRMSNEQLEMKEGKFGNCIKHIGKNTILGAGLGGAAGASIGH